MRRLHPIHALFVVLLVLCGTSRSWGQESAFPATMASIVERLRDAHTPQELLSLDRADIDAVLTDADRAVLATEYWRFTADVPVVVSVMRHVAQEVVPFWLEESGFEKTDLRVKNENYEYEVWQKAFPAGTVGLGINGFEKHRPHYFVCVGPQEPGAAVSLSDMFPADPEIYEMRVGSSIYHDWPDLVLSEVPAELEGQLLLPTKRGRAREAQLLGATGETPFPAGPEPDQIVLTWNGDPRTTQAVQWRTNTSVNEGRVRWWPSAEGRPDMPSEAAAERIALDDGFIINDRRVHRFSATMTGLAPATSYTYVVGSPGGAWSEPAEFTTAPDEPAPFTFLFLSDTHNKPDTDALLKAALEKYPDAAFCTISGDLVSTGQYRDDWDQFFAYGADFYRQRPVVPSIGNHDTLDGLGADLYLTQFALPDDGPESLAPERSYALEYGNVLLVILDPTEPVEPQAPWLEETLAASEATWKFAVFHFPPYAPDEDYPDIRAAWGPLFDRYGVDYVLSGHVHYYLRSHPLRDGVRVETPGEGTVYLITASVPWRPFDERPDYAAVQGDWGKPLYHAFVVDGDRLTARSHDAEGRTYDEWSVEKVPAGTE